MNNTFLYSWRQICIAWWQNWVIINESTNKVIIKMNQNEGESVDDECLRITRLLQVKNIVWREWVNSVSDLLIIMNNRT